MRLRDRSDTGFERWLRRSSRAEIFRWLWRHRGRAGIRHDVAAFEQLFQRNVFRALRTIDRAPHDAPITAVRIFSALTSGEAPRSINCTIRGGDA